MGLLGKTGVDEMGLLHKFVDEMGFHTKWDVSLKSHYSIQVEVYMGRIEIVRH